MQEFQPEANQTPLTTREPLAAPARLQGAELQTFLRYKLRRVKTRKRFYKAGKWVSVFFGLILTLGFGWHGSPEAALCCLFVLPLLLYTVLVLGYRLTRTAVQAEMADMAREVGVHAVGTMFEMLRYTEEAEIKTTIYRVLTRLLPQMKASDANLLTPYARRKIRRWLEVYGVDIGMNFYLISLRVAVLKALEQVGDSRDIPVVERLVNMNTYTSEEEEIQQAAAHCLPILRANCAEVEAARTLLRASQAEDARPNTLLRPASGAGQTERHNLLRGTDAPDAAE